MCFNAAMTETPIEKIRNQMKRADRFADAWMAWAFSGKDVIVDADLIHSTLRAIREATPGDWKMISDLAGIAPPSEATALLTSFAVFQRGRGLGMELAMEDR